MPKNVKGEPRSLDALQAALDAELNGVALYTHLSFRVFGPQWQAIVAHLREQAAESLTHALAAGDRMTMLGGVPRIAVESEIEHSPSSLEEILRISLVHERNAVECYRRVMQEAASSGNVPLEEYARGMVATETDHAATLERMLRPME
jgi:bacterioferritin